MTTSDFNTTALACFPDAEQVIITSNHSASVSLQEMLAVPCLVYPLDIEAIRAVNWSALNEKKVVIWPDNDDNSIILGAVCSGRIEADAPSAKVRCVDPPFTKSEGWNAADMLREQPEYSAAEIVQFMQKHMRQEVEPPPQPDVPMPTEAPPETEQAAQDDKPKKKKKLIPELPQSSAWPFQFLGYDRGSFYYLSKKTRQVVELKAEGHGGRSLLQLADRSWWENFFPGTASKPIDWEWAADELIRRSAQVGVYDPGRVRGRGAWEDNGRSVLHTGDILVVDGREIDIEHHESRYIYEVSQALDPEISGHILSSADANRFAQLCERFTWSKPVFGPLMAGWCVVAPICGALRWRPHVWLTGSAGTGKTWILENIIKPTVGGSALPVMSCTTEAGIRQTLGNDARPVIFDEAEGEDQNAQRRLQAVLELARQASAEAAAAIFKGTANGRSMAFHIRSCFLFSSIGVNIQQQADASRLTVLSLARNQATDAAEQFEQLKKDLFDTLTPDYCASLRARSVALIPIIRVNAETFARAAAEHLGSQRTGDQVGALLAGYYSLFSNGAVSIDKARDWIKHPSRSWDEITVDDEETDEKRCLYHILGHIVRVQGDRSTEDVTVGELVNRALGYADNSSAVKQAESVLRMHGIRTGTRDLGKEFIIANSNPKLKDILKNTPWANGWKDLLSRIPSAERSGPVTFSAGVRARGTILNELVLGDVS